MSFGFGVGDTIKVLELAKEIQSRLTNAPKQFEAIYDEVRSLNVVLNRAKAVLPERYLTSNQRKDLAVVFTGCFKALKALQGALHNYEELEPLSKHTGSQIRRQWKKLKWEPEDIRELRSRIVSNTSLLNASNVLLAGDDLNRMHDRQDGRARRVEHQAVLDWLSPIDYGSQQSDLAARRQRGTGIWLMKATEFKNWLSKPKQTLFCPGLPGAGKTIITSTVVDHLWTKYPGDVGVGIAYLYCNFRRQHEQKPVDLLNGLLKQLVQEQSPTHESLKKLYEFHNRKGTRPEEDQISKLLQSAVAEHPRCFILIDALDECNLSDGQLEELLSKIFNIQAETGANLFATSRHISKIKSQFADYLRLEIHASEEDLQTLLQDRMSRLPQFVLKRPNLQDEIKTKIAKAVDGIFLFAQLHLESLIGETSPKTLRRALQALPTGSEGYDLSYQQAMERVEGQIPKRRTLAKRVLSWIVCAQRPLTTRELRHALAVEIGEPEFDGENLPEIEDLVSACAGLVTVDFKSDIIRLVHYTAHEYFERTQQKWFPNAQRDITETCVTYLSFDTFKSGPCETVKMFESRLQKYIFYRYAAKYWGFHIRETSMQTEKIIFNLLFNDAKVSSSFQATRNYLQTPPTQLNGVHLSAFFGLRESLSRLINHERGVDFKDSKRRTPLSWAAICGHFAVVELLLHVDDVDPDSRDEFETTPLSWAARKGHIGIVQLLLKKEGVDPKSRDFGGRTPLHWAACQGHEEVVKLLLQKEGVNPDSKDYDGKTPLSWASGWGHTGVAVILLQRGVNSDSKDSDNWTPLCYAASGGNERVFKLLLDHSASIDFQDNSGFTPLMMAAGNGHEQIVKILLENNVGIDTKDHSGKTALMRAAARKHERTVQILIENDADVGAKDNDGATALIFAASSESGRMVKMVLRRDSNVNAKGQHNRTALMEAVYHGNVEGVKALLENNAEVDATDTAGGTALLFARLRDYRHIEQLLLEYGASELEPGIEFALRQKFI